jgi:hypothetical protein
MKTRTVVLLVLLLCGGLSLVAVALCGGAFFFLYKNADASVSPRIDALFAKIDDGTFGDAYLTDTSLEFRERVSQEQWDQIGLVVKQRLGRLKSKSMSQFNARQLNATATIDAVYNASFAKGSGTISVRYRSIGGQWLLDRFYVQSPLLDDISAQQKCPHCGELTPASAKFCANCGKSLKTAKSDHPAERKGKPK